MMMKKYFNYDPLKHLLSVNNKALKYFITRDLLNKKVDTIRDLWSLPSAQEIFKKQ